ncbi:hypothetical protein EfmAA290_14300 [Enterococcus faecium]|nr:hypothetical protein EfmAA290_14300 [Enterococcus faecium]
MIDLNNWRNFIQLTDSLIFSSSCLFTYQNFSYSMVWCNRILFVLGNLYRGIQKENQALTHDLGELSTGVIVCETFDEEIIERAYQDFDDLILEVVMPSSGEFVKRILAATADSLYCHPDCSEHFVTKIRR